jgi:hypothetical protein
MIQPITCLHHTQNAQSHNLKTSFCRKS